MRGVEFVRELAAFEEKNLLRAYKFGVLVLAAAGGATAATEEALYGQRYIVISRFVNFVVFLSIRRVLRLISVMTIFI